MTHDNNFDVVRLLAAVQVMGMHSIAWLQLPYPPMWLYNILNLFPGVAVFFVVSGFLIAGSLARAPGPLRYAESRVLRIFPALWVNLIAMVALMLIAGQINYEAIGQFAIWLTLLFFTGNDYFANLAVSGGGLFRTGFFSQLPPSGVLWTIPVELSFYALAPLILAKRKYVGPVLGSCCLISLVVFMGTDQVGHPTQIAHFLWIFLLGSAAQVWFHRLRPFLEGKVLIWFAAYLACGAVAFVMTGTIYSYATRSLLSIAMTVLMAGTVLSFAYSMTFIGRILKGGDISYGIYLWHMPVIFTLLGFGMSGWMAVALTWAAAAFLAILSWRCIEKPALRLKGRLLRSMPTHPPLELPRYDGSA